MALSSCSALGYSYGTDFCLLVGVDEEQDEFTVDTAWIVGAFFLGLILGVGLVLILARPCLNAWEKKKQQDEEKLLGSQGVTEASAVKVDKEKGKTENVKPKIDLKEKITTGATRFQRKLKMFGSGKGTDPTTLEKKDVDPAFSRGMVDIMQQTSSTGSEVEMADQDMAAIVTMEGSMEEEKEVLMPRVMGMLLRKKVEKRQIPKNFYINFVKKTEEDVKDLNKMIEREKEEAEEKLRNDPKLSKDSQTLETEMQKLQTDMNIKQAKLQRDYKDKMRLDLLRSSGMSESEVDEMMAKLMDEMAVVEEKLGLEQARQRRALEQRLARRRQAIEFQESEEQDEKDSMADRISLFGDMLSNHLKDERLSKLEGQRDDIIGSYASDLDEIQKFHASELGNLLQEKGDALQKLRLAAFYKQAKNQEKEKAALLQTADKNTNTREFIKVYHDLMTKHHMEQETLCNELDQKEVQEMHKIKQGVAKEKTAAMNKAIERQTEKLENVINLTATEADKMIRLHKAQMADYNARRQRERQAKMVQLQEKLKQRMLNADEAEARDQKEQEVLKQEQMNTMSRVLATNMELTEEAKERVLREHEQNMQALSNQLLRSKLRQQKSLEIKLNQRKAKLNELKERQKAQQASPSKTQDAEKSDKPTKLDEEVAKEEASFEEARQQAVAELRRQLAKETEDALKVQDAEIGLLIGRLQVGQARRKAILEKQDATLKELQNQLQRKVTEGEMPSSVTDHIIQEHYNHVTHLNEQLQRRRETQQRAIMQKLQSKKADIEEQIESQLERDAQDEYTERQKRGAGYASLALMQSFLEQKHARAMQDLESDMLAELEKSKAELNMQLELEMKRELESQRQSFLTQLAAVSNLSKRDLTEAVAVATGGRPDSRAGQQLTKELHQNVERAKSSLSMDYSDRKREPTDYRKTYGMDKPRSEAPSRKGSAARQRYGQEMDEDDESLF